jgi:outer membrane protein assembly factor BamB
MMRYSHPLLALLFIRRSHAAALYATHYSGTINTLNFNANTLTLANSSSTGNTLPSYITYDSPSRALYIADEVFYGASSGNLASFVINSDGALKANGKGPTALGVVATSLYGGEDGKGFIVNAH